MKFKYFRDPDNFSFKLDEELNCSICNAKGLWFEASGFSGINEIQCICDNCLSEGKLKELEIEANEAYDGTDEDNQIIMYRTPTLPTWQDRAWPFVNGECCIFERMAAKADFDNIEEFKGSFMGSDKETSDLDWLWEILPEKRITNHKAGNFNVSVYLFTLGGNKYCIWDAS